MSPKEELAVMEEAQLAALEEIASIKEQIARAKARAAAEGEYSDADWYQRANRALRHKQIEHQSLLQRAAELRKRLKQEAQQEQNQRFEPAFIAAAKGMLDGDTFQRIVQRANAALATAPGQWPHQPHTGERHGSKAHTGAMVLGGQLQLQTTF